MAAEKSAQKTTPSLGDYFRSNIREYGLLIALVVIMLFFQFMTGGVLFRPVNITNLILQNSFIVIMALGMLLIIVAGHIDLSVGSIVAFTGGLSAIMLVKWGIHYSIVVPVCLILGGLVGAAPRVLGRLPENPGLHRDAGGHARLPRPDLSHPAEPADRPIPEGFPVAVDRLRPRFPVFPQSRCRARSPTSSRSSSSLP